MTTLAERLGHRAGARLLIVNCDDLGSSHAANMAIRRALTDGIATSATLMVPCPWAREAASLFPGADIGVHLTLTAEYPGYRWRSLTGAASLHDADGFLPATVLEVLAKARPEDVRGECRAQIDQALAWGVDVTHLDAHMGVVQVDPRFYEIYLDLGAEYALPLRMVGPKDDARLGFEPRARAAERGVIFTDHFLDGWGEDARTFLFGQIPQLSPGVTEVYGHPAEDGEELRGYDPKDGSMRVADGLCFTDPDVAALITDAGVVAMGFRPLRDLQRRGDATSPLRPHRTLLMRFRLAAAGIVTLRRIVRSARRLRGGVSRGN